jgi:hypothetical protein
MPGRESERKCLKLPGNGSTLNVEPSHPVALRPGTRYLFSGKVRTEGQTTVTLEGGRFNPPQSVGAGLAMEGFVEESQVPQQQTRQPNCRILPALDVMDAELVLPDDLSGRHEQTTPDLLLFFAREGVPNAIRPFDDRDQPGRFIECLRADFAAAHFGLPPRIVKRVALVLVRVS